MPAEGLDSTRKGLEAVTSVHVYSVQAASPSQPADVSAQVRFTKYCFIYLFICFCFVGFIELLSIIVNFALDKVSYILQSDLWIC